MREITMPVDVLRTPYTFRDGRLSEARMKLGGRVDLGGNQVRNFGLSFYGWCFFLCCGNWGVWSRLLRAYH